MQSIFISKITKTGTSLSIVLPVSILKAYHWERGDYVIFGFTSEQALFVKKLSDSELEKLKPVTTHFI